MRWPFCPADARGKRLTIGFLLGTLVAFLLLLVLSFAMFHAFRTVATTGGILTPDESQVAGVGEAVDLCGFLDPAFSSVEDLHRVQDVAFSANGAFHFYRVASIHQTPGGGVRIEAEDGTRLLVQDGTISFERQWLPKELVTADAQTGAALKIVSSAASR
ncbi:unnamed protein product [Effrenium voratum]|nr:unnamed protein product [Effrenium voratum]